MYDVTSENSFKSVRNWMNSVQASSRIYALNAFSPKGQVGFSRLPATGAENFGIKSLNHPPVGLKMLGQELSKLSKVPLLLKKIRDQFHHHCKTFNSLESTEFYFNELPLIGYWWFLFPGGFGRRHRGRCRRQQARSRRRRRRRSCGDVSRWRQSSKGKRLTVSLVGYDFVRNYA